MRNPRLKPPFTPETAAIAGRKGGLASAAAKRARKLRLALAHDPDQAVKRTKLQIDKILTWMEETNDKDRYAQLAQILDRLWDKAFPRQASVKPARSRVNYGSMPAVVQVQEQPQAPQPESQPIPQNGQVG